MAKCGHKAADASDDVISPYAEQQLYFDDVTLEGKNCIEDFPRGCSLQRVS